MSPLPLERASEIFATVERARRDHFSVSVSLSPPFNHAGSGVSLWAVYRRNLRGDEGSSMRPGCCLTSRERGAAAFVDSVANRK